MSLILLSRDDFEELKRSYYTFILGDSKSNLLSEIIETAINLEGSLVRAQICYAGMRARDGSKDLGLRLASAIEYFHLASLLLDDLPCMDNASVRRGNECMHIKFGEANTILAALSLINKSYILFYEVLRHYPKETQEKCSKLIDTCLGIEGILNGQALDLGFKYLGTKDTSNIRKIAVLKTASLFSLAISLPALLHNASALELKYLNRFSIFSGLLYQTLDDLKDILKSNSENKTPRDYELSRPNIVLALGETDSTYYVSKYMDRLAIVVRKLKKFTEGETNLYQISYDYFKTAQSSLLNTGHA